MTITSDMEDLGNALFLDTVPASWAKKAYPSLYGLSAWYADLLQRVKELETWTTDFQLPASVWLAGFFNPQSFLTAIMQQMARKNEWPLDRMCIQCDVTKKSREDMAGPPREGLFYIFKCLFKHILLIFLNALSPPLPSDCPLK